MELLLNLTIYLPLLGVAVILAMRHDAMIKWIALAFTLATLALSVPLMLAFDTSASHMAQFVSESDSLIGGLDIKYIVGLDGLSLLLFMLTTFMGPIVVLSAWDSVKKHLAGFYSMLLILQTGSLWCFCFPGHGCFLHLF